MSKTIKQTDKTETKRTDDTQTKQTYNTQTKDRDKTDRQNTDKTCPQSGLLCSTHIIWYMLQTQAKYHPRFTSVIRRQVR